MRDGDREGPRCGSAAQPRQVRHGGVVLIPDLPTRVVGLGVDVVDTRRFAATIGRTPGFIPRVFTSREIDASGGHRLRTLSLAGRWAVKEAVAKVLVDTSGLSWHDCEVLSGPHGEPIIEVRGSVAAAAARKGIGRWLVSLSHDGDMAVAVVIAGAVEPS